MRQLLNHSTSQCAWCELKVVGVSVVSLGGTSARAIVCEWVNEWLRLLPAEQRVTGRRIWSGQLQKLPKPIFACKIDKPPNWAGPPNLATLRHFFSQAYLFSQRTSPEFLCRTSQNAALKYSNNVYFSIHFYIYIYLIYLANRWWINVAIHHREQSFYTVH